MKLDYSKYRFTACVDWISLNITFESKTNFMAVQRALSYILNTDAERKMFVKPICAGEGGASTHFEFSLQAPEKWSDVQLVLDQLNKWKRFAADPSVIGIEIAVDAYNRAEYNHTELVRLAEHYCVYLARPASNNRRFNGLKGSVIGDSSRNHISKLLTSGRPLVIGNNATDEWSQRIYVKTVDNSGQDTLASHEHRARFENTFRGAKIAGNLLSEWSHFQFQKLSKHYHCMCSIETNNALMDVLVAANTRLGERRERRHRTNGKVDGSRLYAAAVIADTPLNKKIYDALRGLSSRWKSS
jgi:hypothetical protein